MTPEDKAYELTEKFYQIENDSLYFGVSWAIAKASALIAVNEMLEELDHLAFDDFDYGTSKMMYWVEVKEEIKKL